MVGIVKIINLLCVALILPGQPNKSKPTAMCNGIRDFWLQNSNNTIVMSGKSKFSQPRAIVYRSNNPSLSESESIIKNKFDADFYAIINQKNQVSHAGNKIAHLKNDLIRTANHEIGHLLGLGHSGVVGDMYGDRYSVMGKFPSDYLAGPQYKFLGIIELSKSMPNCTLKDWNCKGSFLTKKDDVYYSLTRKNSKEYLLGHKCRPDINNCRGTTLVSKVQNKIVS